MEIGMVIAGHGRLLAARELGFSALPPIDGSYLTAQERRAYMIADNQIALTAGWDLDMLSSEIGELDQESFDLSLSTDAGVIRNLSPKGISTRCASRSPFAQYRWMLRGVLGTPAVS